jgi:peptide deformylase
MAPIILMGPQLPKTPSMLVKPESDISWIYGIKEALARTPNGVGLAAPQIGINEQVAYIWTHRKYGYFIINPEIVWASPQHVLGIEGCLSYPGLTGSVSRSRAISVNYYDENWIKHNIRTEGLEARIIQHEMDHFSAICQIAKD